MLQEDTSSGTDEQKSEVGVKAVDIAIKSKRAELNKTRIRIDNLNK